MAEEIIINPFEADDLAEVNTIHRTYKMDFEKKRIGGKIDNLEATQQAIVKALMTRRFAHQIYDDQYGCDIGNKIGNTSLTQEYFDSDIRAMIEDALLPDDTVIGVEDVTFLMDGRDSLIIKASIQTIYGETTFETNFSEWSAPSIYTGGYIDMSIRSGDLYAMKAQTAVYQTGSISTEIRDGNLYVQYEDIDAVELALRNGGLWVIYS